MHAFNAAVHVLELISLLGLEHPHLLTLGLGLDALLAEPLDELVDVAGLVGVDPRVMGLDLADCAELELASSTLP